VLQRAESHSGKYSLKPGTMTTRNNGLDRKSTFFRWAGGKRRSVNYLRSLVPSDYAARFYWEPFLGAGSLFFALRPKRAHLSDLNADLVAAFQQVRANPGLISRYLGRHFSKDCRDHYYLVRDLYNRARTRSAAQAARFIYLNRTCFNGIFRVNLQNNFNVPYGYKKNPRFPSRTHLEEIGAALSGVDLLDADYEEALSNASKGDFVYLDPPYPPLNGTSFFRHYTPQRFDAADQARLATCVADLTSRGCLVMMSNADTLPIRQLYSGYFATSIPVTRHVTSKKVKHVVRELIITNYLPQSSGAGERL
jgi:DNA adenine methylase